MSESLISRPSTEPNILTVICDEIISIKPWALSVNGIVVSGQLIKMSRYNTEDVLNCLIEEYGKEELLKRINQL